MMHCRRVVGPAIQSHRWDNATDINHSFHSSLHENNDNNACKMWHNLISSLPFSKVSSSFLWIGLCAATVLGTTRGTLLSGRAACFWNNDLDKNPTTAFFDSLTAKTLPLDRGHPHTAAVCLLETKGIEAIVGNSLQRRSVKANGNMTPCVKRYYFLYSSHTHHSRSNVPGYFATRRSIMCNGRILCTSSGTRRRSYGTALHGTAWNVTSRHTTARHTSVREEGNGSAEERNSFNFNTRYPEITEEHPLLFFLFLFFSRAFVNYSPFPALSSRPHVRRRKRLGGRKLEVAWVWCFEIPYQEMWTWTEPKKKAPKLSHLYFLRRKTMTTHSSAGNVCILTLIEGEKRIDF